MEELVSMIIPAYQEERRIERCLQSIAASTYRSLELIVINDGSTDDTEKIARDFKRRNESKHLSVEVVTISNGGAARARNYGLGLARGTYIGFADADDMLHPQMIEKLVNSLQRGNDLSACGLLFCAENGKPKVRQKHLHKQQKQCPSQALSMIMWDQVQMSLCTALFRREKIMDMKGKPAVLCPENVAAFEDFAFLCEYISRCDGRVEILPFKGYFYCSHEGSETSKIHTVKEICCALQPVLAVGERVDRTDFIAHKLIYTFLIMEFWYREALRRSRCDFSHQCEDWGIYMREIGRYADVYMNASNVALYRKAALWVVRKHPEVGRFLAKTIGRLVF